MSSLVNAFRTIIQMQGRDVTLEDLDNPPAITIKMAPSNYFRNFEAIEETVHTGREYVVSKYDLDAQSFPRPERGFRVIDSDLGNGSIKEVREMIIMGVVAGYRLRVD